MLRFRDGLKPLIVSPDRVLLIGENQRIVLAGAIYPDLVRVLESASQRGRAACILSRKHGDGAVSASLKDLLARRLLVSNACGLPVREAAYWESLEVEAHRAETELADAEVALLPLAQSGGPAMESALKGAGLKLNRNGAAAVVVVDDYLDSRLEEANRSCRESGQCWLPAKLVGRQVWLGPLFLPEGGACWECLRPRLIQNRWMDLAVWGLGLSLPAESQAASASSLALAASIAAAEVAKWIVKGETALKDTLLTFDTHTLSKELHPAPRRLGCAVCGNASQDSLPARARGSGGDLRSLMAEHYSPITGFVSDLRDWSRPQWAPVKMWAVQYAVPVDFSRPLVSRQPDLAAGKGLSDERAQLACMAEAAERYSACVQGGEPKERFKYRDVAESAVHPARLQLFSDNQYAERERWNAAGLPELYVPEPLDEALEIDWLAATNWGSGPQRLIPSAYCLYNDQDSRCDFCHADSNGCAARPSLEEAVLNGFYELVERDAAAIWWYNRVRRPSLSLDALDSPLLKQLAALLAGKERDLYLLDLTTDWEVPAYAALSRRHEGNGLAMAFAAHHDPLTAAHKAVLELIQNLTIFEDDGCPDHLRERHQNMLVDDHPYLRPQGTSSPPRLPCDRSAAEWLALWARRAERKGTELLSVDLTRPDIGVPVARTIVPGLRHFWPRYAPGRLYTVPVELGWLQAPKSECELNPVPCLI